MFHYKYFGLLAGKLKAVLALLAVSFVPSSHAAVWIGASSQTNHRVQNWVQAGVEQSYGEKHPWVYIEVGHRGHQTEFYSWSVKLGDKISAQLVHKGDYWKVWIAGHHSHYVHVPDAHKLSLLEIYSDTSTPAAAWLNTHIIRGH